MFLIESYTFSFIFFLYFLDLILRLFKNKKKRKIYNVQTLQWNLFRDEIYLMG